MLRSVFSRGVPRGVRSINTEVAALTAQLNQPLSVADPELYDILEREKLRQLTNLNLIPSENFASQSVMDCLGSMMSNKYSEGYPGTRYYGGNEQIDAAESLCQERALEAFRLDPERWGVNVQPLSGSPANLMTYAALLDVHDRVMALDLPHGGHLTHGFHTPTKAISFTSKYFNFMPYRLSPETDLIDYDTLASTAKLFHPKLIVGGFSAYARHVDYARLLEIARENGALLMSDMAHISGLVAADVVPSPFDHCDVVTTTTHKSLRGPRGAMIFFRKGVKEVTKKGKEIKYDLEDRINFSVFPGHQGGPHNHTISALATALKQAASPEFKLYQQQVLANASQYASCLLGHGYQLVTGGTENHLVLANLTGKIDGARVEHLLDLANFTVNKNTVPGDTSALTPSGVRMGTPALTTRGFDTDDFTKVADFFHRGVELTIATNKAVGSKKLVDFKKYLAENPPPELAALREEVSEFASSFPVAGFDVSTMKYRP